MQPVVPVQDVKEAVLLLQSIGASVHHHLCQNDDQDDDETTIDPSLVLTDPYLPVLCDNNDTRRALVAEPTTSEYYPSYHHLRGTTTRKLLEPQEQHDFSSSSLASNNDEVDFVYNIIGVVLSVCGVALIAGLFLGLLTLDVLQLRIVLRASRDDKEISYAKTLLPIVEERHLLLVTLLLLNTLLYEALPIFLDNLVPTWCAILLSTTLIMFFGEILPSGIFTGPHQLYLGYRLAPLTKFFLWIMYPIAKPLATILDYLVVGGGGGGGEGGTESASEQPVYNRGELSALVRIQFEDSTKAAAAAAAATKPTLFAPNTANRKDETWHATKQELIEKANDNNRQDNDNGNLQPNTDQQLAPPLHPTEVDLIEGALQMKTSVMMDVYTPLSHIYSIPDDLVLDRKGFLEIYRQGYSRVPVYRNKNGGDNKTAILGFLLVRQLVLIDWDHHRSVSTLPLQRPRCVGPKMNLVEGLRLLRTHGSMMVFVCARPDLANKALEACRAIPVEAGFMGIVTLEDVMESVLQKRIYDEFDIRDRDRAVATLQRWAATTLQDLFRRRRKKKRSSIATTMRQQQQQQQIMNHKEQPEVPTTTMESTPLLGSSGISGQYQAV